MRLMKNVALTSTNTLVTRNAKLGLMDCLGIVCPSPIRPF